MSWEAVLVNTMLRTERPCERRSGPLDEPIECYGGVCAVATQPALLCRTPKAERAGFRRGRHRENEEFADAAANTLIGKRQARPVMRLIAEHRTGQAPGNPLNCQLNRFPLPDALPSVFTVTCADGS